MDLKAYFRILARLWWVIVITLAATILATYFWTARQPWIYQTTSTFVIRPRSSLFVRDDFVKALDILSRRVEINTTFAEVASSQFVDDMASERLMLTPDKRKDLNVSARLIGGTNILELTVQGRDPKLVVDFANAVSLETVNYVNKLYDIFELEPLDQAELPKKPVTPNIAFNLSLGTLFGLAMGIGLTFLVHYFQRPHSFGTDYFNIMDRETGAYNKSYFLLRLMQEISRSKRNKRALSLGLIKIGSKYVGEDFPPYDQAEVVRRTWILASQTLREEDILARFDKQILAVLLPDLTGAKAKSVIEKLVYDINAIASDVAGGDENLQPKCSAGVVSYQHRSINQEELLKLAVQALGSAGVEPEGEVALVSDNHTSKNSKGVEEVTDASIS